MSKMKDQDIFKRSSMPKRLGMTWQQAYATVAKTLESKDYRMLRDGNTLLWVHIAKPGVAMVWLFDADRPENLPEHMGNYMESLKKAGYQYVAMITDQRQELIAAQEAGYPVEYQRKQENGKWMYSGAIDLSRGGEQ